jgi:hypothetical protein
VNERLPSVAAEKSPPLRGEPETTKSSGISAFRVSTALLSRRSGPALFRRPYCGLRVRGAKTPIHHAATE